MLRLIGQSPLAPDLLHGTKNPLPHGLPFKVAFPRGANVRYGSKADIPRPTHLRPLSGVKQTSKGHCRGFAVLMSAFGGKADVRDLPVICLLIAKSGHSSIPVQASE